MQRTQIYLSSDELALLDRMSDGSGASRSELIRRAIRLTYGEAGPAEKLRALRASAGTWPHHGQSGSEYVDAIRSDLDDRLRKRGLP